MTTNRGRYVVIEGPDGSGKTSIITQLKTMFKDNPHVIFMKEPHFDRASEIYNAINAGDDAKALGLFLADHTKTIETIKTELRAGNTVVTDRSWISAMIYQGNALDVKCPIQNNISWSTVIMSLYAGVTILPDCMFVINCDVDTAIDRVNIRNEEKLAYEKKEFMTNVVDGYEWLSEIHKNHRLARLFIAEENNKPDDLRRLVRLIGFLTLHGNFNIPYTLE